MSPFTFRFGWLAIMNGNYTSMTGWKHLFWRVWWLDRAFWRKYNEEHPTKGN